MKECDQLLLYAKGELAGPEQDRFAMHLASCRACREELSFLRKTEAALTPSSAPQSAVDKLFAKTSRKPSFFAGLRWKPALAGAAVLGLGMLIFWAGLQPDKAAFDAREVIAYMSENLDAEYQSFADDLSALESEF